LVLITRRTTMSGTIAAGADTVCAWAPLIAGGKVRSVTGEFHLIGPKTGTQVGGVTVNDVHKFHAFGFGGELVPLVDPDAATELNTLWDNLVAKPAAMNTTYGQGNISYDFDSGGSDAQVELGMINAAQLTGLEEPHKTIIEPTYEFTSFAKGRQGGYESAVDADAANDASYQPTAYKTFRGRPVTADDLPAYALLAISSPDFAEEEVYKNSETAPATWQIWSHLSDAMADVWKMQTAGLTEQGAETPFDVVSLAVENLAAPEIIQPGTENIIGVTWTYLCNTTWVLEYPDASTPRHIKAL
jgi:hypothetical protein